MKMKSALLSIIILVVILGSIAVTSAMGLYVTKTEKVPATIKSGEFAGEYDPADIRGSYSFGDIQNSFDIPLEDLGVAFGIADSSKYASYQVKDLEATYGELADSGTEIGTDSIRYFVALYKGLPFEKEGIYLPKAAVSILKEKAKLTSEQINSIEKYSVDLSKVKSSPTNTAVPSSEANNTEKTKVEESTTETLNSENINSASSDKENSNESSSSENTIKGSTTFQDLLDWGVTKEAIEKVINAKIANTSEVIKDFVNNNGGEFGTLKSELQKLVDTK